MKTYHYSTLAHLYDNSVREFADRQGFSMYGGQKLTYSGFAQTVGRFAEIFKRNGLVQGDRIGLTGQNMPQWAAAYFAVVISGMVVVPVSPDSPAEQLTAILAHAGAKAVVVSGKQESKLSAQILASLNAAVRLEDMTVISSKPGLREVWEDHAPTPQMPAVILFTSGTTSAPKGVVLTHRNLCSQLHMIFETENIYPDDVFVSVLPLSHTYECTLGMLLPFMCGSSVVYLSRPPVPSVLSAVFADVRPTVVMSVPLIVEKICKQVVGPQLVPTAEDADKLREWFGGRIRFVGIGGAKLDDATERFLLGSGFPYIMGYGMTETSPLLAVSKTGRGRLHSVGPAMTGVSLRIDDPNAETGEGEILVKGGNVTPGYYENPGATSRAFTPDGWFRTGDAGRLDEDGYLYVEGRLDDVIIGANGENIYPEQIEDILNDVPGVGDVLVKKDGGKLVALVYFDRKELIRQGATPENVDRGVEKLKKELLAYVNERVNKYARISAIYEQTEPFEKTSSQKIKRFRYR